MKVLLDSFHLNSHTLYPQTWCEKLCELILEVTVVTDLHCITGPRESLCLLFITDTCTAVIIPLVQKFCCDEISKQSSESLLTVARLFGKLSYGLSGKKHFFVSL